MMAGKYLPDENQNGMRDAEIGNSPQIDGNTEVVRHGRNDQMSIGCTA